MKPEIRFSRHSTRRMQLYRIDPKDMLDTILFALDRDEPEWGRHQIVNREFSEKYGYPLKVVFDMRADELVIITAYPLKRGTKNEDLLR
jgi:hypothetical protein